MIKRWHRVGGFAAAAATLAVSFPAHAQTGVLWETTSQPVIPGMPFSPPPTRLEVCAPVVWSRPPGGGDPSMNCTASNFQRTESSATWNLTCTNPPMTGDGEIQFDGTDAYAGEIRMNGGEMAMTMKLAGRKLGGCDNPL